MINKLKTIIAVAALSGTVSANAQAAMTTAKKGNSLLDRSRIRQATVHSNRLFSGFIQPKKLLAAGTSVKQRDASADQATPVSKEKMRNENRTIDDDLNDYRKAVIEHISMQTAAKAKEAEAAAATQPAAPAPNTAAAAANNTPAKNTAAAPAPKPAPAGNTAAAPAANPAPRSGKVITVRASAYTASCAGCSGVTVTGINLRANPNIKVIAVDPAVIPLGSRVYIEGFGEAIAADTGGAIKGNRIDVFIPSRQEAIKFGVKYVKLTILN